MRQLLTTDLDWCVRRLPGDLRGQMMAPDSRLILAGGYIRSTIAGEEVSDIDLFAPTRTVLERAIESLESGRSRAGHKVRIVRTKNAQTLLTMGQMPVQAIHRWLFDRAEDCIASFDFTVSAAAIWHEAGMWHSACHDRFYADLAGKRLHYTSPSREEEAGGSMLRAMKFARRGYSIDMLSLGEVISRIVVRMRESPMAATEPGTVIAGLLREVDPLTVIPGMPLETSEDSEP